MTAKKQAIISAARSSGDSNYQQPTSEDRLLPVGKQGSRSAALACSRVGGGSACPICLLILSARLQEASVAKKKLSMIKPISASVTSVKQDTLSVRRASHSKLVVSCASAMHIWKALGGSIVSFGGQPVTMFIVCNVSIRQHIWHTRWLACLYQQTNGCMSCCTIIWRTLYNHLGNEMQTTSRMYHSRVYAPDEMRVPACDWANFNMSLSDRLRIEAELKSRPRAGRIQWPADECYGHDMLTDIRSPE